MDLAKRVLLLGILGLSPFIFSHSASAALKEKNFLKPTQQIYSQNMFEGECAKNKDTLVYVDTSEPIYRVLIEDRDGISIVKIFSDKNLIFEGNYDEHPPFLNIPIGRINLHSIYLEVVDKCRNLYSEWYLLNRLWRKV